jgi:hypothetical protein
MAIPVTTKLTGAALHMAAGYSENINPLAEQQLCF